MNCSQARAELATYRELNKDLADIPELKEHLAQCAECNELYTQFQTIGERIRSMPQIQPPPDAHDRLMQALAVEHVRYLQHTSATATTTPTPAFLVPYLKDLAQQPDTTSLAAFSSANTGPLPIIKAARPRRPRQMSHITIIGLAASFLMVVMMSGLMSLLFLANQGKSATNLGENSDSVHRATVAQASMNTYQTTAAYPHVASASENNGDIYYSAYNADKTSWALQKFASSANSTTGQPGASTSLLATPSAYPIIVLGSNQNWLFWLQMEAPKNTSSKNTASTSNTSLTGANSTNALVGNWSLKALNLDSTTTAQSNQTTTTNNQKAAQTPSTNASNQKAATANHNQTALPQAQTLLSGTFNPSTAPTWVTSPVQGLSFYTDHVLIATIDSKGASHLLQYQFNQDTISLIATLANASNGHVLTSPTATSNGHSIYWAEEWLSGDQGLSSNIWTQQTTEAPLQQPGRWTPHTQSEQYPYLNDGNSFRPQIVDDTLFWISKSPTEKVEPQSTGTNVNAPNTVNTATTPTVTATAPAQPKSTAQPTPVATPGGTPNATITNMLDTLTNADPTVLPPQLDQKVSGQLLAYNSNGATPATTNIADNDSANVSNIESGSSYLVWQGKNGLEMYDVSNKIMVNGINDIDHNAAFIVPDGNTIITTDYLSPTSNQGTQSQTATQVKFQLLQWPAK